jgi:glycosyltransferase involved in cell wall biosynthesis
VKVPVSVMIFTLNEEIHLPRCLAALAFCDDVIVVDSFSTDQTEAIARAYGARFFQNAFTGFGNQRNWALDHTQAKYPWVLILDADEVVPADLAHEMAQALGACDPAIGAFQLRRRFMLWGRWLRYSSLYPNWVVRLIHRERVRYLNRGHAETQTVQGSIASLQCDLLDENLKGLDEWFDRQNRYASKEAAYELEREQHGLGLGDLLSSDALKRRAALKRLSGRVPFRGVLYFCYSYFWRRGFLDGRQGLLFCRMKAWYQNQIALKKASLRLGERRAD